MQLWSVELFLLQLKASIINCAYIWQFQIRYVDVSGIDSGDPFSVVLVGR
jgi:hypothetical protein